MPARLALYLLGCAAVAAGCSRGLPRPSPVRQVLTDADSGKRLVLPVGGTFEVRLPSRPGTGYAWGVARADAEILVQRGAPDSQPVGPARPGGPALESITFLARGPGTTRLELAYRRPWEQGAPPARTFTLDVTVR